MTIHERGTTVDEFLGGLAGVLTRLVADSGRWILIADVEKSDGRYVQFLASEDGILYVEVSSNASLRGESRLSEGQEDYLVADQWFRPDSDHSPNFHRQADVESIPSTADAIARVLRDVFALGGGDHLFVKLLQSALGDPPARHPVEA